MSSETTTPPTESNKEQTFAPGVWKSVWKIFFKELDRIWAEEAQTTIQSNPRS